MPRPPEPRGALAWSSALGPAALLIAVALWEIVGVARYDAGAPGEADLSAAAAEVRAGHRAGDLIVFAPAWIDPLGRAALGDLIPVEMAGRMDADRYRVIWEVAARGARAAETAALTPTAERAFGALAVRRFERAPAVVVTDFVAAAARAEPRVSAGLEEVGFAPRRCIELTPRAGGDLAAIFRDVELGGQLVGYVGLADVFTRRDVRAPGRLHVAIDGDEVARVEVGVDDGWVRFAAETVPGRHTVVFQAHADARDRHVCFAAEARR